jgi:diketogulonate reductase-like aldo/keto reductase
MDFARARFMPARHVGQLDVADALAVGVQVVDEAAFGHLRVVEVEHHADVGQGELVDQVSRLLLAPQQVARTVHRVERLDQHGLAMARGQLGGVGEVVSVGAVDERVGRGLAGEPGHHMHGRAAERARVVERLRHARSKQRHARRVGGQAPVARVCVAGRRIDAGAGQAVVLQTLRHHSCGPLVGKPELHRLKALIARSGKAIEKRQLGEQQRQVGAKTKHGEVGSGEGAFKRQFAPVCLRCYKAAMLRRDLLAATAGGMVAVARARAQATPALLTRAIPRSGEALPAVGLGTWLTFDVPIQDIDAMARRRAVLDRFFALGGGLIDSSPMYGHAEAVLGELLPKDRPASLFAATKVWTALGLYGPTQMRRSLGLWRLARCDLMQVHNLLNWREHLKTLREWQAQGRVRYIGVTTSHGSRHEEMRHILDTERGIDVMQITYNPADRSAEALIARAAERGVAVIINRPFDGGSLLQRLRSVPLPPVAAELGCAHWAPLVLKWELANPAVTVAIPATTNPAHLEQNMAALRGPLPDAKQREAIWRAMGPVLG